MSLNLRNRFQRVLAAALLAAAAVVFAPRTAVPTNEPPQGALNSKEPKNDRSVYAEIGKAPEKESAKRNPFENDPDAIVAGSKLFAQHCAECHGDIGQGGKKAPSLREDEVQSAPPGALFWVLTNGVVRRGMPVWSKLPEPQRWQIVSFLKSLRED